MPREETSRLRDRDKASAEPRKVIVIGAGPAGLAAAYELARQDVQPLVLEQRDKVGGIARTESYKGFRFDLGGHRFFTKSKAVNKLWHEMLPADLLLRPRLSRIYYRGKFFHYPLQFFNALFGLGVWQAFLIVLSFIKWQIFPYRHVDTFEQWVTNRFGKRLFETFFKAYTEKVWGVPTTELKAEWAAQRIKDLSLKSAVLAIFVKPKNKIRSLVEEFYFPRQGPGMLWEAVKDNTERLGGEIRLDTGVVRICRQGKRISGLIARNGKGEMAIEGSEFISTIPISEFIKKMDSVPPAVRQAAENLSYRDFLTVCLIINKRSLFPDNWIYVHSPEVKVGRIQNFKNWSPDMVPDRSKTSLGLEYFCNEGDELWNLSDQELVELGKKEIEQIGLARYSDVEDGCVFRVPKAYPIYDETYRESLQTLKAFMGELENVQTIGRNGLHRYDNMDHAMVTGMLAARNLVYGERNDPWSVNNEPVYNEEIDNKELAETDINRTLQSAVTRVFSKLDPVAFGLAIGVTAGLLVFGATVLLLLTGNIQASSSLELLSQFLPGYSVSWLGGFWGLVQGFAVGFIMGWTIAYTRNILLYINIRLLYRDIELHRLRGFLDFA